MIDVRMYIQKYFPNREIEEQSPYLSMWEGWYKGHVDSFHDYKIYNGKKNVKMTKKSLNIAKKACEDWANLLLNDKCHVTIKDQETLDQVFADNNFWVEGNNLVEKYMALSIGAFVESVENITVDDNGNVTNKNNAKVRYDYISAKKIYPITFEKGKLVECAFASEGTNVVNISIHKLDEKKEYEVINATLKVNKNGIVENGESVYTFKTRSKKPLYQIIKPNVANNIDIDSPLGISIFANAIDTLKAIDNAYDSFDTEIQYGRRRIFVDEKLIEIDKDGNVDTVFDPNDVAFYVTPARDGVQGDNPQLIQEIASQLRTNDISLALQEQLNVFSASVGFGKNYYTFGASGGGRPIQTATGIIAQNSDMFRAIKKHEILLEKAIVDLVEMTAYLTNEFTNNKMEIGDGVVVTFDDSIIEDTESQKSSDRTDVTNGVMSKVEYRMKWYGEDEETATKNLDKFSLNDLDIRINSLLTALQSGAITPEEFARVVYKGKDEAFINGMADYITQALAQSNAPLSAEDLGIDINE